MPLIPYAFEEPEEGYESLIEHQNEGDFIKLKWSGVESALYHKGEFRWYPDLDNIAENTNDFKFYPNYGFRLGRYSEFLIAPDYGGRVKEITVKIDSTEISIGQATPLAMYLLDGLHDKHIDPEWNDMFSIRILGPRAEKIESYLLFTVIQLTSLYGFKFEIYSLSDYEFIDEDEESEKITKDDSIILQSAVTDIEPLRLFYKGINSNDNEAAFLQFYRIIEYYSVLQYQDAISNLRWDRNIPTKELIIKLQQLISKEERGPICRLISDLAEPDNVEKAVKQGLIDKSDVNVFANTLYEFRNSIVHAKYDQRTKLYTESVLKSLKKILEWRDLLYALSLKAINTYGNRDI